MIDADRTPPPRSLPPAALRLSRLAPLGEDDLAALLAAIGRATTAPPQHELVAAGAPVAGPRLIVSGWAARVRTLADGRRQFLGFLLPGDLFGLCRQPRPVATATVVAMTAVATCSPPPKTRSTALREAYAIAAAMEEAYLLGHIVRLGRLSAYEKIADLMLEFDARLGLAGLADRSGFALPLTQEVLGDTLGLTSVHINRTAQQLRRDGDLIWSGGHVQLPNPRGLAGRVGWRPVAVSR